MQFVPPVAEVVRFLYRRKAMGEFVVNCILFRRGSRCKFLIFTTVIIEAEGCVLISGQPEYGEGVENGIFAVAGGCR